MSAARSLPAFAAMLFFPLCLPATGRAETNPHYGPIHCTACHVDEEEYELKSPDFTELCNSCHVDHLPGPAHHPLRKVTDGVHVPGDWPLADGELTCLTCHLPSHEEYVGQENFLRFSDRKKPEALCARCHRAELWEGRDLHLESNGGKGCEACHQGVPKPGEDTMDTVRFFAAPTVLCLRCHGRFPHPGGFDHTGLLEPRMAEAISQRIPLYEGRYISCSTCHNPHVLEIASHKLRDFALESLECPGCHGQ